MSQETTVPAQRKIQRKSKDVLQRIGSQSIKNLTAAPEEEKVVNPDQMPKQAFTEEEMQSYWQKYAYGVRARDLEFFGTLTNIPPVLKDNFIIELTVLNVTQEHDVQKHKNELLNYLKQCLNNFSIELNVVVDKTIEVNVAFTPQDKLKRLIEKNPLVEELKNKLDLGF